MAFSCRVPNHISHVWPPLPLQANITILSCEQRCQWCPLHVDRKWDTATALRKHARTHLKPDSQFGIISAGAGGRQPTHAQQTLLLPREEQRSQEMTEIIPSFETSHQSVNPMTSRQPVEPTTDLQSVAGQVCAHPSLSSLVGHRRSSSVENDEDGSLFVSTRSSQRLRTSNVLQSTSKPKGKKVSQIENRDTKRVLRNRK